MDTVLDQTLTYRLHVLVKLSERGSATAYRDDAGLPMSEGRCLSAIGSFSPLSIVDLAHRANLTKGQASRAAQSLVDQGLVSKVASATDGRGVVLDLTRTGRAACKRVMAVIEQRNEAIFGVLGERERAQFGAQIDRIVAHLRQGAAGEDDE
jgi:DNA-binding MarR family transcriptional regulator